MYFLKNKKLSVPQAENEDLIFAKHIANEINKISDGRTKAALKLKIKTMIFEAQYQLPQPASGQSHHARGNYQSHESQT